MAASTGTHNDVIRIDSQYQYAPPAGAEEADISILAKTKNACSIWLSSTLVAVGTIASSYLDFYLSAKIERVASQSLGICLGNFISKPALQKLAVVMNPVIRMNKKITELFSNNSLGTSMFHGALEEVEFRWFVQGVLLKQIPAKILKVISPGLEEWIDSVPAKVTRIAAVALLFGFVHFNNLDCSHGGAISQLLGGIIYGTMYETMDSSPIHCINMHMLYNLYCTLV